MRWPWQKRKEPPVEQDYIDLDQDSIPMDHSNLTGEFFMLVAEHGPGFMTWREKQGHWELAFTDGDKTFTGPTQRDVITQAQRKENW